MIMFQSNVGSFKFKSYPSPVYTQSFLKVFKVWYLRSKIILCTNHHMFACPPILHYLYYTTTRIKRSFSKVVMGLQGKCFNMKKRYISTK